ncbi:aminodeoxychorismate synthase component I [Sorangium sp. So ce726]|uniref:aminodeoxychorismate synthase component I n=1 Tax=Sorangium sp. So ce726 TaxID=3133319 RepID=UPI003F5F67E5
MTSLRIHHRKIGYFSETIDLFRAEFLRSESAFLLESSVTRSGFARFSFMGDADGPLGETVTYDTSTRQATVVRGGESRTVEVESVFDLLRSKLVQSKVEVPQGLPFDFNLGYVGFLGYELKAETIGSAAHRSPTHDAAFIFATRVVAFDHAERTCYLLHLITDDETGGAAEAWFDTVEARMRREAEAPKAAPPAARASKRMSLAEVERWIGENAVMRFGKEAYIRKIHESLVEIVNGESYEVCLTNMIDFSFEEPPFELYCVMRSLTPAPHAGYFRIGDFHLVSSSPERFLSVDRNGRAEAKPIKGTRPRGRTEDEDRTQAEELRANEKDRAENLMIVDLLRNDLGQVCTIGSVHVPKLFDVETYSHVHQLVSTIRGQLKPGVSAVECVRAVFPGGSMTGAPKKRTMEIIDRLEEGPRGVYSGAFGWLGLSGACDLNIIIRSVPIDRGHAWIGVGGAITALSDPNEEFAETIVKARGVVEAVEQLRRSQS